MTMSEEKRKAAIVMAAHFEKAAEQYQVKVIYYTGSGRAFPRERKVMVRPVRGPSTYFAAMHELGHIVGPGRSGHKLEREAMAWNWAFGAAIRKPTKTVRHHVAKCLRSYLYAGRRRSGLRQGMIEPPEHHVFWQLANPPGLSPKVERLEKP